MRELKELLYRRSRTIRFHSLLVWGVCVIVDSVRGYWSSSSWFQFVFVMVSLIGTM